jgi:hypothetical protein
MTTPTEPVRRVDGPCPFCRDKGGTITCDFEHDMLLHSLPVCEPFERMTADEFVQAVIDRKHLQ